MQNFELTKPAGAGWRTGDAFIAGGTDLLQLMKNDVAAPSRLVDLDQAIPRTIAIDATGLRLGALASMAEVAADAGVRKNFPMIAQALELSASPQIRNMGTMGGNLLQRTRCNYFRDPGFACNKRQPGSGCPAQTGDNRDLAVFGGSPSCIATHPSDLPVPLMAFDAAVHLRAHDGSQRQVALADFYRLPGSTPEIETVLAPGEVITEITVPTTQAAARSTYVKVRDRTSFAFALVSAAVGLHVEGGLIREARIALGGVAPMPWRLPQVEAALVGQKPEQAAFEQAVATLSAGAKGAGANDFKIELARRTVIRGLSVAAQG